MGAGRKGKYEEWLTPEGLLRIEGWARDGLSDSQIAQNIGIGKTAFYEWKQRFPKFAESLKQGKDVPDRKVENAVMKAACGYVTKEIIRERDRETGELVITKIIEREVPPNVIAQKFWLVNRKPAEWTRDKQPIQDNDDDSNINIQPVYGRDDDG